MTSKERVQTALNHKQPDQVPVDFGGSATSGVHVSTIALLRDYYGLEKKPVKVTEPYQMLGEVDNELREAIGIDTVTFEGASTIFGFRNEDWKEYKTLWGQEVLVSKHFNTTTDETGNVLIYPEGDMTVLPSGKMPKSGYFFDSINRQQPIDDANLNVEDNLEEFKPISDSDLEFLKKEALRLKGSDKFVFGSLGGTALGDIALVPAPNLKVPKGIRDVSEWYMSIMIRPDYVEEIFAKQTEIALKNLKKIHGVVGDVIDAVFVCGTDFGTQTSSFCSTDTFDAMYLPYYKKINDWIHKNTTWKTFKHSCGAVENFMPHFIEAGFDIINPVQISATGMDPQLLKDRYGDKLTFWGGGVDTQKTLPFGKPEEVRTEVLKRCEIFAKNGGFVFNSIHNIQALTPIENLIAMIDAVKEFNGNK